MMIYNYHAEDISIVIITDFMVKKQELWTYSRWYSDTGGVVVVLMDNYG